MNYLKTDYRPAVIEFDVANNGLVPDNLGYFENMQKACDYMGLHLTAINQKITVFRFMDNFEKSETRKEYNDLLENKIPILEKELMKAHAAYTQAKKDLEDAKESVSATINETKALAMEVKRGVKDITLDDLYTWKVPFNGQFYFYTFIDGAIKLVKISDIPESEKNEIFNSMSKNHEFFEALAEKDE
jgi:hypothetical protein